MSDGASLHRSVESIGEEAGAAAVAVAFCDWERRTSGGVLADRWFHAASTIKVPVLLAVFDAIQRGGLAAASRVHVRNRFLSVADASPYRIDPSRDSDATVQDAVGRTLRVDELARQMIVRSSNLATNVLVDLVGLDTIRATLDRLGLEGVELRRGVEDLVAWEAGIINRVTAEGLLGVLRAIRDSRHFTAEATGAMLDILHAQEFRHGIPAGLPDEARVAHKTGEISSVAHDAGIVFLPDREPYGVVILTEWETEGGARRDVIAAISRAVWAYVTDGEHDDG